MQYFMHPHNLRDTPVGKEIMKCGGVVLYGVAMLILEVLIQYGDNNDDKEFKLSLDERLFGLDFWARELYLRDKGAVTQAFFTLAACKLLDQDSLEGRLIHVPMLRTMLDEYAKKKARRKRSVGQSESVTE